MEQILITSYINPDIDGIACMIAYSEFLNKLGQNTICGILGVPQDEAKYGNIALAYFQNALQAKTVPAKEIPTITYLMGEIHRRLSHKSEAGTYFDQALALASENEELQFIAKMAKQQKESPKDQFE